ncbi:hypothetical protein MPL1032_190170 [Mesorhizobium plurifarium]|uniref:Uncharacterized protein n=1 Tax=Mesorhizobium plurifarium TaxID=69974 RepID=A0A0K2VVM8_MESPL|nr:hypothetical protein MPL1032_190170 [Mesorhizobium plurifarium]
MAGLFGRSFFGERDGIRTHDLLIKSSSEIKQNQWLIKLTLAFLARSGRITTGRRTPA